MKSLIILSAVITVLHGLAVPKTPKATCYEGFTCSISPGVNGVCIGGECVATLPMHERRNLSFTISVKYPEEKLGGQDLFIRGNGLGLSWQAGVPLTKVATDSWETTINFRSGINGYLCESCADQTVLLSDDKFEYRILISDTQDMLGANFAVDLPVTKTAWPQDRPVFQVFPWFFETTGTATNFTVNSIHLGKAVVIALYLPPSFNENPYKKYGGLLVYDMDPVFLDVFKREVYDHFMAGSGIMEETILVGWAFTTENDRFDYLTPIPGTDFVCKVGTFEDQCGGCFEEGISADEWFQAMTDRCGTPITRGGRGDLGLDFFLNEALPEAVELAGGRLLTDREHLGMNGYSLGGLMTCYAVWTRPDVFSYGACQSSSLYWPTLPDGTQGFYLHNVSFRDPQLLKDRKPQRIYLDAGGLESGPPFWMERAALEAAEIIGDTAFFNLNENVWFNFYPEHMHSYVSWMSRFWSPVSALMAPKGTPTRIANLAKTD